MNEPTRFFDFSSPQIIDVVVHAPIHGDDAAVLRDEARTIILSDLSYENK
jgi:hypothetical protein